MPLRSYSDVPKRVVNLFLQEAGALYDVGRGHPPFRRLADVLNDFGNACAYCGNSESPLVEEHVVPRNRVAVGLRRQV